MKQCCGVLGTRCPGPEGHLDAGSEGDCLEVGLSRGGAGGLVKRVPSQEGWGLVCIEAGASGAPLSLRQGSS